MLNAIDTQHREAHIRAQVMVHEDHVRKTNPKIKASPPADDQTQNLPTPTDMTPAIQPNDMIPPKTEVETAEPQVAVTKERGLYLPTIVIAVVFVGTLLCIAFFR